MRSIIVIGDWIQSPDQSILNNYYEKSIDEKVSKYRIVAKKLAVAAIAVLSVLLVGRRGGTGAPLRAAVFILSLLQLRRRVTQRPICHFVPLTSLIPTRKEKEKKDIPLKLCYFLTSQPHESFQNFTN